MKYRCLALLALLPSATLCAQDITPSPLAWLATDDNPDALPVPKGLPSLELSDGLRAMPGPAYVEYRLSVTAKGKVGAWSVAPSAPWFAAGLPEFSREFVPAKRDGSAVASEVALCYIYNPATAGANRPDAIPRLLAVLPPIYPDIYRTQRGPDRVVQVTADVDSQGAVTAARAVEEKDGEFAEAAVAAVRRWVFAPARQAGQPVAASIDVPVAFKKNVLFLMNEVAEAPKPIARPVPMYPQALRRAGISGEVVLSFVISVEGRVVDPYTLRSDHPAFEDSAMATLRQWRFKPAMKDGRPVPCVGEQLLHFAVDERDIKGGIHGFHVAVPKSWPESLPEEMRFEVPPSLVHMEMAVYPREDLLAKRDGKVTVAYVIDPKGAVSEVRVLPGTHTPAMAGAAVAAMEQFRFTPPGRKGKPCYALLRIEFEFVPELNRGDVPVTEEMRRAQRLLGSRDALVNAKDLDQRLRVRTGGRPKANGRQGEAVVEVIVDRDGVPRLPQVVSASDPALGYTAIQAVSNWRFQRPIARGKYVDTVARVPFSFK